MHSIKVTHPRLSSDSALRCLLARFTREILESLECRAYLSDEQVHAMESGMIDGADVAPYLSEVMLLPFGEVATKTVEVNFKA